MNIKKIISYLKNKKVAKTNELTKIVGNKMALLRLSDSGVIQNVSRGYYSLPRIDILDAQLIMISKYYPEAIISGLTAAYIYELTDESVNEIEVDIPNKKNIQNSSLRVRRIDKKRIIGIITKKIEGESIKIYDVHRTLVDIYLKYPGHIFYKALKRYIKKYAPDFNLIKKYDEILKTNVLKSLMQELADE